MEKYNCHSCRHHSRFSYGEGQSRCHHHSMPEFMDNSKLGCPLLVANPEDWAVMYERFMEDELFESDKRNPQAEQFINNMREQYLILKLGLDK